MRPEYQKLVCRCCGWWNPRKAAELGISPDVRCPFRRRDVLFSDDGRLMVSRRARKVLEDLAAKDIQYFDLPGDDDFFLAIVRNVVSPPKDIALTSPRASYRTIRVPFIVRTEKCTKCGHYTDVAIKEECLTIAHREGIWAVILDRGGRHGYLECLFASEPTATILKKAKLTGLWLKKSDVNTVV